MSTYDATDAAAFIQAFDAGKLTFAELVERFRQTVLPLPPPDAAQQPEYARQSFDHIVSGTRRLRYPELVELSESLTFTPAILNYDDDVPVYMWDSVSRAQWCWEAWGSDEASARARNASDPDPRVVGGRAGGVSEKVSSGLG